MNVNENYDDGTDKEIAHYLRTAVTRAQLQANHPQTIVRIISGTLKDAAITTLAITSADIRLCSTLGSVPLKTGVRVQLLISRPLPVNPPLRLC